MVEEIALGEVWLVGAGPGDPSLFARSMEEVDALAAHGVGVRICPGVTAASAAAASAAVSLSLRGLARRVQFVTAHVRSGDALDLDWAKLADPQCTTAFYMGRTAAVEISRGLMDAGLDRATPVLIACDISLPGERLLRTRLDLLPLAAQSLADDKPTLILVGEAVGRSPACAPRQAAAVAVPGA